VMRVVGLQSLHKPYVPLVGRGGNQEALSQSQLGNCQIIHLFHLFKFISLHCVHWHCHFNIQNRGSPDDTQVAAGDPQGTEREEVHTPLAVHIPLVEAENQGTELEETHMPLEVLRGNSELHNFDEVALVRHKAAGEVVVLHTDLDCKEH
jgi:hypothetical protein